MREVLLQPLQHRFLPHAPLLQPLFLLPHRFLPRPQPANPSNGHLKLLGAGLLARREPLTPRAHHVPKLMLPRPREVVRVPTEPRVPAPRGSPGSSS